MCIEGQTNCECDDTGMVWSMMTRVVMTRVVMTMIRVMMTMTRVVMTMTQTEDTNQSV